MKTLYCVAIALTFSLASVANAAEKDLITVKVEDFPDTELRLIVDANNHIQGVHIVNTEFNTKFSLQEFKSGYVKRQWGFKVVSIKSPNLNSATGGNIEIEYRKKAEFSSGFGKLRARLRKDEAGNWIAESVVQGKTKPFKTLELVVTKQRQPNGEYKFQSIDGVKLSSVLDFNPMLAALQPARGDEDPAHYTGEQKILSGERTIVARDFSDGTADRAL